MTVYTLREICQILEIDESFGFELERESIIAADEPAGGAVRYSARMLERARVAYHLVHDLDVNLAGAAVIVRLREEMVVLQRSVRDLAAELERRRE
jgi:hypothetical protein